MSARFLILPAAALVLAACGGNSQKTGGTAGVPTEAVATEAPADMHNAENALDYAGTYKGTTPAADCPGIEVTLTLHADGTYTEHDKYIDRDAEFDSAGKYRVEGSLLTLTPDDDGNAAYYKVGENHLRRLDADKQPITGALADHYTLTKTTEQ